MTTPLAQEGLSIPAHPVLGEHVTAHLRRLIISGELAPQTHLVEAQLSKTFDVSRGPIRDALRRLETEGLVQSHRRGVFVAGLNSHDIDELYSLREVLELKALKLVQQNAANMRWELLETQLEAMRSAADSNDADAFAEADLTFHTGFYTLSGHGRLHQVWRQYEPTFAVMLSMTNAEDRDLHPTLNDHVELLELARSGNEETAAATLREHLDGSRRRLLTAYHRLFPAKE